MLRKMQASEEVLSGIMVSCPASYPAMKTPLSTTTNTPRLKIIYYNIKPCHFTNVYAVAKKYYNGMVKYVFPI